jgi:glycosyltransferase involved in cell wall biosynthesis
MRQPIKVLQVIPSVTAERGGTSTWLKTISQSLAARGADVHVATTDDGHALPDGARHGVPYSVDGVTYWYFPRQTSFYTVSLPLNRWLKKHVSQFDIVHIHAMFSYPAIPAAFWAYRNGVPYVVQPHGMLSPWGMSNRRRWLKRLSLPWIERRILSHSVAVALTSQQEKEEADALGVDMRSLVIPLGADVPDSRLYAAAASSLRTGSGLNGRKVILFLGRLEPKKGLDLLLNAFAKVRRSQPEAVLVVAGSGDPAYSASLKDQASELGIAEDVRWVGFQQGAGKWAWLAAADIFALPSYAENFGIATVEAMRFGLALLITDQVGIHREVTLCNAGLVCRCGAEPLAEGLERLLRNEYLRSDLGAHACALAEKEYTVGRVTSRFLDLYREASSDCHVSV